MASSTSLGDGSHTAPPSSETLFGNGIASRLSSGGPEGSESDTTMTASSGYFYQSTQQDLPQVAQQLSEAEKVKQKLSEAQQEIKALNGELWTERTLLKQLKVATERRTKQRREANAEFRGAMGELLEIIAGTTRVRSQR